MKLTSRQRTVLGVALFLPLAAAIAALFACLPAPIGDPDTAKIDDKLTGAWEAVPPADAEKKEGEAIIVTLRPWDQHTWFVQYMTVEKRGETEKCNVLNFKGWLARIADADFIVLEALDESQFLIPKDQQKADNNEGHYYWVARLTVKGDSVTARPINNDSEFVKGLDTREKLEAAIKTHLNDDALYEKIRLTFKKLAGDDLKKVEHMRKKLRLGLSNVEVE